MKDINGKELVEGCKIRLTRRYSRPFDAIVEKVNSNGEVRFTEATCEATCELYESGCVNSWVKVGWEIEILEAPLAPAITAISIIKVFDSNGREVKLGNSIHVYENSAPYLRGVVVSTGIESIMIRLTDHSTALFHLDTSEYIYQYFIQSDIPVLFSDEVCESVDLAVGTSEKDILVYLKQLLEAPKPRISLPFVIGATYTFKNMEHNERITGVMCDQYLEGVVDGVNAKLPRETICNDPAWIQVENPTPRFIDPQ